MRIPQNKPSNVKFVPGKEEVVAFTRSEHVPLNVELTGITFPNKNYSISRDSSSGLFVFEYVRSGAGYVYIDGEWVKAKKGDTYLLKAGEPHYYFADSDDPWCKIWINFHCDYMAAMMDAFSVGQGVYSVDTEDLFMRFYRDAKREGARYGALCMTAAEVLNEMIFRIAAAKRDDLSESFYIAETLRGAVYKKVSIDEIASDCHLSKSQLIRKFKAEYHVTPYEYLIDLKLETAKLLLLSSGIPVKDIAEKLCFYDEHYFSNCFYRRYGIRPRDYRAQKGDGSLPEDSDTF